MKVLIVFNLPAEKKSADDIDVLTQVEAVRNSLEKLGHTVSTFGANLNLESFQIELKKNNPDFVFNLVESLEGVEKYLHFVPTILENLNIPFSGGNSESLYTTTNKVLTKRLLDLNEIPTPRWKTSHFSKKNNEINTPYIIKPIYEDASVGLHDSSIIFDTNKLDLELSQRIKKYGECFIEEYIDGREFNISVLETKDGPIVLPIAEIRFENYPSNKVKIVNYDAKWNEDSFEYKNTIRHFDFTENDENLLKRLKEVSIECWEKFILNGYARIDFRVDQNNNVYVLEINVNPCISPDSGFYAACEKNGWSYTEMVEKIIS